MPLQAILTVLGARKVENDPRDFQLDLSGLNLAGVDLKEADLRNANMAGVDLTGANLSGAKLSGVRFYSAILCQANFEGADCRNACFGNADLREVNFRGANLEEASFVRIGDYMGRTIGYTDVTMADFSHAQMRKADMASTWTEGYDGSGLSYATTFAHADMREVNFGSFDSACRLQYCSFEGVRFERSYLGHACNFEMSVLRGVDFRESSIDGSLMLKDASLTDALFEDSQIRWLQIDPFDDERWSTEERFGERLAEQLKRLRPELFLGRSIPKSQPEEQRDDADHDRSRE
ncbi:MAG: pentapeptide repeat-containing protein [Bacteroidota bacterium]